jgi:2-isopropylmalate synthase
VQLGDHSRDGETVRRLRALQIPVRVEMVCLAFGADWRSDVERSVDCGADIIQSIVRSSDPMISQMSTSRNGVVEQACAHIKHARDAGASSVTFAPSFCFAADPEFLQLLCASAVAAGADCVNLVDTLGTARPEDVGQLVSRIRQGLGVPVGVGAHNDLGLATANVIAGLRVGATRADVSLNGLGERAGHAALEQVAAALALLYDYQLNLDLRQLRNLCELVASVLGVEVPPTAPVVGSHAFAQRLESHVRIAAERPELFEPFPPATVGNSRQLVIGKGSGPVAIGAKMTALGYRPTPEDVARVLSWVGSEVDAGRPFITDHEFEGYLNQSLCLWPDS